jgi:hypothetical protein
MDDDPAGILGVVLGDCCAGEFPLTHVVWGE